MIVLMLWMHWAMIVFVCGFAISSPVLGGSVAFILILGLWSIHYISVELEMPFGDDANDLPILEMQRELNRSLMDLMRAEAQRPPAFKFSPHREKGLRAKSLKFETSLIEHRRMREEAAPIRDDSPLPTGEASAGDGLSVQAIRLDISNCAQARQLEDRRDEAVAGGELLMQCLSPRGETMLGPKVSPTEQPLQTCLVEYPEVAQSVIGWPRGGAQLVGDQQLGPWLASAADRSMSASGGSRGDPCVHHSSGPPEAAAAAVSAAAGASHFSV